MVTAPDIPGHQVGEVLGSGGFATVYRSWQLAVGREVAVKVDNRVLFTERDRRRFFREVTAAGRLSGHPHVIDVYDAGTLDDGRPYLIMELCPGGSLNDILRRHGPMPAAQVRDIGVKIADALTAAHLAGVLHRDIKPANILVNRYGVVGLSDFGLASIVAVGGEQTASRDALTPAYSAPESFRGEEPTVLADVYALAATLYALLAGRPPSFAADGRTPSLMTIMALHDRPVQDVPGAPAEFMALLRRGLSPDPAARPQTAAAFRDALIALPGPAVPPVAFTAPPGPAAEYAMPVLHGAQPASPTASHPAAHRTDPASPAQHLQAQHLQAQHLQAQHLQAQQPPAQHPRVMGSTGRLVVLAAAVAAVVAIAAAVVIAVRLFPHHAGSATTATQGTDTQSTSTSTSAQGASAPGTAMGNKGADPAPVGAFGIATVQAGCPAAALRRADARCPATPECWAGLVEISGVVSAETLPCNQPHYWETFAIAIMPAGAQTFDEPTLTENPTVREVCSLPVLLASRRDLARRLPASAWQVEVLPPTEAAFDSGTRTYRCVGGTTGSELRRSQFRR